MDNTLVPHRITLRSGQRVLVRAPRPDDGPGLAEAFEQLSETSRYRRFFAAKPHLSAQSLAYFTDVDHPLHRRGPPRPRGAGRGGARLRTAGRGGTVHPRPPGAG